MASAIAAVAALSLFCPSAGAAKTEVQPPEEVVQLILLNQLPGSSVLEGTHVLDLTIYPLRGVAIAAAQTNDSEIENKESAIFAEQIPKSHFDGHVDVAFAGLGSFVGDFSPTETSHEKRRKGCAGPPEVFATGKFSGSIRFSGWDGYAGWKAPGAEAIVERRFELHCRPGTANHFREPKTFTDYVEPGYGSFSGWRYALEAIQRRPHRFTELNVYGYGPHEVNFDAVTYERLAGGIVASRSVFRSFSIGHSFAASRGGYHPERAVLRPPAPFSGVGVYSRSTHRLTGSLAVQFPGLRYRLAGPDTVANLVDEAGLPEKKPTENP